VENFFGDTAVEVQVKLKGLIMSLFDSQTEKFSLMPATTVFPRKMYIAIEYHIVSDMHMHCAGDSKSLVRTTRQTSCEPQCIFFLGIDRGSVGFMV
jgi:hypothetical protein